MLFSTTLKFEETSCFELGLNVFLKQTLIQIKYLDIVSVVLIMKT